MLACPTWIGGKDWATRAYSPRTNTMYMPLRNACARMMATRDGGMDLYALAVRNEFAPGFDQLGTVQAISAETAATEWLYERRSATMSLVATGGGLLVRRRRQRALPGVRRRDRRSALGDQPRLGGERLPDHLRGRREAVRRGEHGHRRFRIGVHSPDAGDHPERGEQPVRLLAERQPLRPRAAGARCAERHRDAPAGAAAQGRGRRDRNGAGVRLGATRRRAGVRVSGAHRGTVGRRG